MLKANIAKYRFHWQVTLAWMVGIVSILNIVAVNIFPIETVVRSAWVYTVPIVYISSFLVTSNTAFREQIAHRKIAWILISASFLLLSFKRLLLSISRSDDIFITSGVFIFTILGLIIYFPKRVWSLGNTTRVICDIILLSFALISLLQSSIYYVFGINQTSRTASVYSIWVGFEIAGLINTIFLWRHYRQPILRLIVLAAICIVLADVTGTIRQWYFGVYRTSGLADISFNHIQKMAVMLFAYYSVDHFVDPPADQQRVITRAEWRYRTGLPRLAGFISLGVTALLHPPDPWVTPVLVLVGLVQIVVSMEEEHHLVERAFRTNQELLRANAELRVAQERLREAMRNIKDLAVQEERRRLALEIHDSIGHHMTNVMHYLEAAAAQIIPNLHKAQELFQVAEAEVRQAHAGLLRALDALSTDEIATQSLDTWLHGLVRECLYQGVLAELYVEGETQQLPPDVQHALYRVAQEAVTNIKKHAQASEVMFKLTYSPGVIEMLIQDDGVGMNDPESQHGRGLKNMRARVEHIGGAFQINSSPNQGFTIQIHVPFTQLEEEL